MMLKTRILLLILAFLFVTSHSNAQHTTVVDQVKYVDASTSLLMTYGWIRDAKSGKWTSKEKEIKDVDSFESYSILTFRDNKNQKYVAIVKETKEKSLYVYDTYLLDYNDYADKISLWEQHTLLRFPILKHQQVKLKKGEPLSREVLGLSDFSNLLVAPRDYFVFQYKFLVDSTVKFLFYVDTCIADVCESSGLETKENLIYLHKNIGKESLYDHFFYKTTPKYFTNFTDLPLNK